MLAIPEQASDLVGLIEVMDEGDSRVGEWRDGTGER
jgi:hypothetical protein